MPKCWAFRHYQRVRGEDPSEGGLTALHAQRAGRRALLKQCASWEQLQLAGWDWLYEQPHPCCLPPKWRAHSWNRLVCASKWSHQVAVGSQEPCHRAALKERLQFDTVNDEMDVTNQNNRTRNGETNRTSWAHLKLDAWSIQVWCNEDTIFFIQMINCRRWI